MNLISNIYETNLSIEELELAPGHEAITRSWRDTVLLQSMTNKEPWICSDYALCGDVRHAQRKNACLLNSLMALKDHMCKRDQRHFESEAVLYRHITGIEVDDSAEMPLTLAQCEPVFESMGIAVRVIDKNENLVYRVDNANGSKKGRSIRLVVDGHHAHPVRSDQVKSFIKMFGGDVKVAPTVAINKEIKLKTNIYLPTSKREAHAFVQNLNDIIGAIRGLKDQKLHCLSLITDNAENCLLDVMSSEHMIRPSGINNKHGLVSSFLINFDNQKCYIHQFSPSDEQTPCTVDSLREYNAVADGMMAINKLLFSARLKSQYSPKCFSAMHFIVPQYVA
jgi:hypothetical protein